MMTFYAAAGSYQIRSEDGKNMPYIMRLGKLQPVSIPEFSLWSMLLWDVLTYEELHKKFYDKMEETEIEPSSFDKSLEMLVKRKLIIKGVGYTGADAPFGHLCDSSSRRPGYPEAHECSQAAQAEEGKLLRGCLSAAAGEEFGCRAQDHEAGASDPAECTGAGSLL